MLQGSGAMPTLVVEEGLVPFASGETPTATWCCGPQRPCQGLHVWDLQVCRGLCFPPKPAAALPRWCCRFQWGGLRALPGAVPPSPSPAPGRRCVSQCPALPPAARATASDPGMLGHLCLSCLWPRQTPIPWIPPTRPRRSPPCNGWQRSCPPASGCRGGRSASSWSTYSRLLSATGSAGPWRASSSTGGWARVVVGASWGGPQVLPRLAIRVSLPMPPEPASPGRHSQKAVAGTRGPGVVGSQGARPQTLTLNPPSHVTQPLSSEPVTSVVLFVEGSQD